MADPHTSLAADTTAGDLYLTLVRDEDIMHTLDHVADDVIIEVGTGLAVEAYERRYDSTRALASARFGIPGDVIDLLTSAALTALYPTMGAAILARPNEATLRELRHLLAAHGLRITEHRTTRKGRNHA
ncbi:MAG: hypothetical protein K0R60_133 [Microbacterium sp.]|jgi:hypothetical protein|nr:hypothetical protein [Microbacterium sp.]